MHLVEWVGNLKLTQVFSGIKYFINKIICLSEKTLCDNNPCKNGGTCNLIKGDSNYTCNCSHCSCAVYPIRNCEIRMYTTFLINLLLYFIVTRLVSQNNEFALLHSTLSYSLLTWWYEGIEVTLLTCLCNISVWHKHPTSTWKFHIISLISEYLW